MRIAKIGLLGLIMISSLGAGDIKEEMEYRAFHSLYNTYSINAKKEKCEVTYRNKEEIHDTTCLRLTNSKKIKILCTKTKKMCKTEKEMLDFIKRSKDTDEVNQDIQRPTEGGNTKKPIIETKKEPIKKNCTTKPLNDTQFNETNPYHLKSQCVKAKFKIVNVVSATEALGYNIILNSNYTRWIVGDRAVRIIGKGDLGKDFSRGVEIKGVFKILGTEKLIADEGQEVTGIILERVSF